MPRRKGKHAAARPSKNRQIHFWVDPALCEEFESVAENVGDKVTDAHRNAMQGYVDQNSPEGSAFVCETTLKLGAHRVTARIFNKGEREVLIRLMGPVVPDLLRLAGRLRPSKIVAGRLLDALGAPDDEPRG